MSNNPTEQIVLRHRRIQRRADLICNRIDDQARAIGQTRAGTGRDYVYHLAHNWQHLEQIGEPGRSACREILRLQRRAFRVQSIARAMIDRVWTEQAAPRRHKGGQPCATR